MKKINLQNSTVSTPTSEVSSKFISTLSNKGMTMISNQSSINPSVDYDHISLMNGKGSKISHIKTKYERML